jgi:hypothetical protein
MIRNVCHKHFQHTNLSSLVLLFFVVVVVVVVIKRVKFESFGDGRYQCLSATERGTLPSVIIDVKLSVRSYRVR